MPTSPFSSALVTKLAGPTAWRFDSDLGEVFTPGFFCCDEPNALGISAGKHPTAIIRLSPNPAYVGETVNYSGTTSYDPDGSITGYAWTFEGHTPASGTASAGTLNYGTAGLYEIQLIVTDGTGNDSAPARVELLVQPGEFSGYAASTSGVYYSDGTSPITWTAKNTGLSGNDLIEYDVTIDPASQVLDEANKAVWRCGVGNVIFSPDGGATWYDKTPGSVANTWEDSPAPSTDDLTFRQFLWYSTLLFVMATWQNGSGDWRSTLFYASNISDLAADPVAVIVWTEIPAA